MSKQDRQGVRTARDIEAKYDLRGGRNSPGGGVDETRFQQLNQTVEQFIANTNAKFEEIEIPEGVTAEELKALLKGKADLVGGQISSEQLPDFIGDIYTASKSVQITTAGIDTFTDGASLTVPKGVYVIVASAVFYTGSSSGARNIQTRLTANSIQISMERIVAAANNYARLEVTAIYKATGETKLTVQKSSSMTESQAAATSITALRIVSGGTSSSGADHTHTTEDIEDFDAFLESLGSTYAKKDEIPTVPTKVSAFENDEGYLKEHQSLEGYAKTSDIPTVPTKVSAFENDKGYISEETDPTVPAWAKTENKPVYTADEVGADAEGTAFNLVSAHNTGTDAHNDIRLLIQGLTARLDAVANSSDDELDQLSEIVTYIKNNKSLIDSITTSKVNVTDIINNLTTNVTNKPLSAAMGVILKAMIDDITVPTKVSQLQNDSGYLTQHQDLSAYAKRSELPTVPTKVSAFENDKGYLTEHQSLEGYAKTTDIPTVPTALSQLSQDATHRVVTDTEKATWNAKSNLSASNKGYNGAITAGGDGVAEMGKYIDFHNTADGTSDYSTRMVCTGEHRNTVNLPSATGTLIVGDRALKVVITGSTPTANDTSVMTVVI